MKKATFWIIFLVIIIIVILGGWSLMSAYATSVELEEPRIILTVEKGIVQYKSGDQDYTQASGETELHENDMVKTAESGQAKIVFFDTQEMILDENTEIKITQSLIDENSPMLTQVEVELKEGQVWSRLLELLHPQASYEVEADNVVATVRGTSFNVYKIGSDINVAVFENSVGVYDKENKQDAAVLEVDDFLSIDQSETDDKELRLSKFQIRKLKAEEKKIDWLQNNIDEDSKFRERLIERRKKIFRQLGPLPGEKAYNLKLLGEKIALALAIDAEKKEKLEKGFELKRILEAERLIDIGKRKEAINVFNRLDIDPMFLPQVQRLRAMDPDFKSKLLEDSEFKEIYLKILFDKTFMESLLMKLSKMNLPPRYQAENIEKYIDDKVIDALRQELVDMKEYINKLQDVRKDLLLDLETLENSTLFETDKEAQDLKIQAEQIRKQLFDVESQLQDIQEKRRALIAELDKMNDYNEYNFSQINNAKTELDESLSEIEKNLEQISLDIENLADQYSTPYASEDNRETLFNQPFE